MQKLIYAILLVMAGFAIYFETTLVREEYSLPARQTPICSQAEAQTIIDEHKDTFPNDLSPLQEKCPVLGGIVSEYADWGNTPEGDYPARETLEDTLNYHAYRTIAIEGLVESYPVFRDLNRLYQAYDRNHWIPLGLKVIQGIKLGIKTGRYNRVQMDDIRALALSNVAWAKDMYVLKLTETSPRITDGEALYWRLFNRDINCRVGEMTDDCRKDIIEELSKRQGQKADYSYAFTTDGNLSEEGFVEMMCELKTVVDRQLIELTVCDKVGE